MVLVLQWLPTVMTAGVCKFVRGRSSSGSQSQVVAVEDPSNQHEEVHTTPICPTSTYEVSRYLPKLCTSYLNHRPQNTHP